MYIFPDRPPPNTRAPPGPSAAAPARRWVGWVREYIHIYTWNLAYMGHSHEDPHACTFFGRGIRRQASTYAWAPRKHA